MQWLKRLETATPEYAEMMSKQKLIPFDKVKIAKRPQQSSDMEELRSAIQKAAEQSISFYILDEVEAKKEDAEHPSV